MSHTKADRFIQELQASTETIGWLGFLSAIIPIFIPFVFGISLYRARQCRAAIDDVEYAFDSRITNFRWRFIASAIVSGTIMPGLIYWMATWIKW